MESDRLAAFTDEARAILQGAINQGRADLDPVEDMRWRSLYRTICELRGTTPMTSPAPASGEGDGWRISSSPRWPHAYLEAEAAYVTRECFPWGTADRWQWRWGVFDSDGPFGDSAARCFYQHRLILVDEDQLARRSDRDIDLWKSITEEATHIQCGYGAPDDPLGEPGHSNVFYRTLHEARVRVPRIVAPWLWSRSR